MGEIFKSKKEAAIFVAAFPVAVAVAPVVGTAVAAVAGPLIAGAWLCGAFRPKSPKEVERDISAEMAKMKADREHQTANMTVSQKAAYEAMARRNAESFQASQRKRLAAEDAKSK